MLFFVVVGVLVAIGLPIYQRHGLGAAIRAQRAREDVVVAEVERLTMPGLTPLGPPSRLPEDELRQGYAISRTPSLELFMCGDACTGWAPGSPVSIDYVLVDTRGRTPEQVCRALVRRFATAADPARLAVSERGPIDADGCGIEGTTPGGTELDIRVQRDIYTAARPVHVLIGALRK